MGKWYIFLITLGIATKNGVLVPEWAWVLTITLTVIGSIAQISKTLREEI